MVSKPVGIAWTWMHVHGCVVLVSLERCFIAERRQFLTFCFLFVRCTFCWIRKFSIQLTHTSCCCSSNTKMTTKIVDSRIGGAVAGEVHQLHKLVNELRRLGLEQELPIPQIAVCGDQSTGKSSVLEALSGVPFPRGDGLVTRCATELIMTEGESWEATVDVKDMEAKTTTDATEVEKFIRDGRRWIHRICRHTSFHQLQ